MADLIMCFMPLFSLIFGTTLNAWVSTILALVDYIVRNHDLTWVVRHFFESLHYIL
jgi:hypothetical protein